MHRSVALVAPPLDLHAEDKGSIPTLFSILYCFFGISINLAFVFTSYVLTNYYFIIHFSLEEDAWREREDIIIIKAVITSQNV